MVRIVHIVDDPALGGVNRLLDSLIPALSGPDTHTRLLCQTRFRLPPRLEADAVVVHATMGWNKLPFLAALRRRTGGARIVLVEHTYTAAFEARCVPEPGRFRRMLRLAYRLVDQVVAVSTGQANWMIAANLLPPGKVRVIPCVNDISAFLALPLPATSAVMRLGAYGRFDRQKGYDTLIAAMARVPGSVATLDLAGYGADEAALRAAAAGLDHVTIHGRVDPVAFISEMDAIAIPSRWEAGAVTCWEARAAGRPTIVADIDGLPEQVPSEIGLVVRPDDVSGLAAAIVSLAGAHRPGMARRARESTEGAFGTVVAGWHAVLAPAALQPDPAINQAGRGSAAAVIAGTKARSTGTAARPGLSGVFVQRF